MRSIQRLVAALAAVLVTDRRRRLRLELETTRSPASEAAAATPATKLKGKPIVIGSVGSFTGPQAPALGAVDDTLKAWAEWKNANGGINGHPVKLIIEDDGSNADQGDAARPQAGRAGPRRRARRRDELRRPGVGRRTSRRRGSRSSARRTTTRPTGRAPSFFATGSQVPALVYGLLEEAKKSRQDQARRSCRAPRRRPARSSPGCSQAIGQNVVGGIERPVYRRRSP